MTRLTARFVILLSFCLAALSSPTGQLAGGDIVPGNEPDTPDDIPNPLPGLPGPSIPAYPPGVPRDEGQYGRVGVVVPPSNHNNGANDSQTMPHTRGNDGDSTTHHDGKRHKEVSSTRREDPDYHPHHHHHDHRDDDNVLDHHHANGTDHGDHHRNGPTTEAHVPRADHKHHVDTKVHVGHHHGDGLQAGSVDVPNPKADHGYHRDDSLNDIAINLRRADHEHHQHHHHSDSTADGHVSRADRRNHHDNPLHVDSIEQNIDGSPVGIHIDEHHNH